MKIQPETNPQISTVPCKSRKTREYLAYQRLEGEVCYFPHYQTSRQRKLPAGKKLLIDCTVWLAAGTRQWSNWFRRLMTYAPQRDWTLLLDYTVFDDLHQLLDGPHHSAAEQALNLIAEFRSALEPLNLFRELPQKPGESFIMPWERAMRILHQEENSVLITKSMSIPDVELSRDNADQYIYYAENYVPLIR